MSAKRWFFGAMGLSAIGMIYWLLIILSRRPHDSWQDYISYLLWSIAAIAIAMCIRRIYLTRDF